MRLLQLAIGTEEILDLHPNVTVVVDLDDEGRSRLVDAVHGIARGVAPDAPGLLEAHGVLFDLDAKHLGVLEPAAGDLDPVVRAGQLPTQPVSVDERELRTRERAFAEQLDVIAAQAERQSVARDALAAASAALEAARRARAEATRTSEERDLEAARLKLRREEVDEQRRRVEEELEGLRGELDALAGERRAVEERTAHVREGRDEARALRVALQEELASVEEEIDPAAGDDVASAADELARLEAELEAERARASEPAPPDPAAAAAAIEARVAELEERLQGIDQLLLAIGPVDRGPVESALALVRGGAVDDLVPSQEAAALADELDRIAERLVGPALAEAPDDGAPSLAEARARLDDARQRLLEAEQAVRSPDLDPDDVQRLEDVHDQLLDALDRTDRRFGGARAKAQVEELRAAESEVLERLGFASYSDYMMGHSLHGVDPLAAAELDAAREELAAAEDLWRQTEQLTEVALARAAVLDRRRELLATAKRLLGHLPAASPPQDALRALRVPAVPLREAADDLRMQLDAAGVDLGDEELDHEDLSLIAEAWLGEADQAAERHRAGVAEREALDAELADRRAELAELQRSGVEHEPAPVASIDAEAVLLEEIESARARQGSALARQQRAEAALARRGALVDDLRTAEQMEAAADDEAAGADAELAALDARSTDLAHRLAAVEARREALDLELAEIDGALGERADEPDVGDLDARLAEAEAEHAAALEQVGVEDRALAALDAEGRAAALEIERLQDIVAAQGAGSSTPAEELEWYLLARVAAQRSVSVAGSVPLLLDDALRGLQDHEMWRMLDRLERMAEAVQVIVLSSDPVVASWADEAGPARAAVVRPTAR